MLLLLEDQCCSDNGKCHNTTNKIVLIEIYYISTNKVSGTILT